QEVCARSGGALARRQSGSARVVSGKSVCERAAAGNSLRAVAILVYDFRGKAAEWRLVEAKIHRTVRANARTRGQRTLRRFADSRTHRASQFELRQDLKACSEECTPVFTSCRASAYQSASPLPNSQ